MPVRHLFNTYNFENIIIIFSFAAFDDLYFIFKWYSTGMERRLNMEAIHSAADYGDIGIFWQTCA